MAFLSQRLNAIKPSATLAMTGKVQELQDAGKTIIGLSAGEPDFSTPEHVCQAANVAMNMGKTKYTAVGGTTELKQAIVDKFRRENNLDYERNQVIASTGGKQVIYNALMATIDPGDEVIIPAPYWVSYYDMVLLAGGRPIVVECPEEVGFKIHAQQLNQALSLCTKWVFLNSPSNPSGAAYTKKELSAIADVLKRNPNVHVLSDDIYEHILYTKDEFCNIVNVAPELKDRTLIVNGVSKAYSMTGWRIGYGAGSEELISAMAKIQGQSTSNASSISQAAAVAALNGNQSILEQRKRVFQTRRDMSVRILNDSEGLTCRTPEGAFYVFPSCAGVIGKTTPQGKTIKTDEDFVTYLLESQSVACVHGAAFGMSPYFRISYATTTEALEEALSRIQTACAQLK